MKEWCWEILEKVSSFEGIKEDGVNVDRIEIGDA